MVGTRSDRTGGHVVAVLREGGATSGRVGHLRGVPCMVTLVMDSSASARAQLLRALEVVQDLQNWAGWYASILWGGRETDQLAMGGWYALNGEKGEEATLPDDKFRVYYYVASQEGEDIYEHVGRSALAWENGRCVGRKSIDQNTLLGEIHPG